MKNYRPPVKPAKLGVGEMWAAVRSIERSDGCGPHEKTWACEMLGYHNVESAARDAALDWWSDTDQSGECDVTFAIEVDDGTVTTHRVKVAMELRARVVLPKAAGANVSVRQAGPAFEASSNRPGVGA